MMDSFITKNGKKMRRGYTTGSCAAAAAGAAALMLLENRELPTMYLKTPAGMELTLPVLDIVRTQGSVSCAVQKDSGDDPDVTNGIAIYANVEKTEGERRILIDGGCGIGQDSLQSGLAGKELGVYTVHQLHGFHFIQRDRAEGVQLPLKGYVAVSCHPVQYTRIV